ncbi:hypothetical protein [Labrenzia sp. VG12]|uniref:hypothetical protein n=1 Tax=Labrenzia sp. VG12 TaxID=2021862 RepID=UPI000B8BFBDF|nr:hypothetical protein [Labrenzia sp. VG12]ASP34287.1 hypothetical protein CHH27_14365 [Labrenzia sp. VG12]
MTGLRRLAQLVPLSLALIASGLTSAALADPAPEGLVLELNKTEDTGSACRLSFVLRNATGADLEGAAYELVLFSQDGIINQMSVFDFGALPAEKTVVRQFELQTVACAEAGRLLINGPSGCTETAPAGHCRAPLSLSSRTSLALTQ